MPKFIIHPGVDLVAMLKKAGYSTYRISKSTKANGETPLFGSSAMTKFRKRGLPSWGELAKLVDLLHVSPMALIAWQRDDGVIFDLAGHRIEAPSPAQHQVIIGHHPSMDNLPEDFWTGSQDDQEEH